MQAIDTRTYLCVKNIPCRYSKKELKDEINKTHRNMFWNVDVISDKKEPNKKVPVIGYVLPKYENTPYLRIPNGSFP